MKLPGGDRDLSLTVSSLSGVSLELAEVFDYRQSNLEDQSIALALAEVHRATIPVVMTPA